MANLRPTTGNIPSRDLMSPEFARLVAERTMRRAKYLRAQKAWQLGQLVEMLRKRKGWSRGDLEARNGPSIQWLYLLEQQLLEFEDLSCDRLEALGKSLEVSAIWLAEACGFSLEDCPPQPITAVLAVGRNAATFLSQQQEIGARDGSVAGMLELADPRRFGPPPDYIKEDLVLSAGSGSKSVASFLSGADLLLLVADLTEFGCDQWPLLTVARHAAEEQGLLVAALLLYRPSREPMIQVRSDDMPAIYHDMPLREALSTYLNLIISVNMDTLAVLAGAHNPLEASRLADEEFSRLLGDLLLTLREQDLTGLRQYLGRSRAAALGLSPGDSQQSPRALIQKALDRRATEADFTPERPFVLATVRAGAMSEQEQRELDRYLKKRFGANTMVHIVSGETSPGQARRAMVLAP